MFRCGGLTLDTAEIRNYKLDATALHVNRVGYLGSISLVGNNSAACCECLIPPCQKLKAQEMSNILLAFATLGHPAPQMALTFIEEVAARASTEEFDVQAVTNILWSVAMLQVRMSR